MNKICLALALLASSFQAGAEQVLLQGSPTESTTAIVSRNEPNLFRIDGRKIRRIYGTEGLFTVTAEAETGVAWLKPLTDKPMMSVFITDDTGQHFKLLLKVEDIPAETIIIRGKGEHDRNVAVSLKNEPATRKFSAPSWRSMLVKATPGARSFRCGKGSDSSWSSSLNCVACAESRSC